MDQNQSPIMTGNVCRCPHHKVVPLMAALIGLDFLLGALNVLTMAFVNVTWPILLIIGALTKMNDGWCKCNAMHK